MHSFFNLFSRVWKNFDESIAAKELIDESLFPFHEQLIKIHSSLRERATDSHGVIEDPKILHEMQQDLNRLENGRSGLF
jgi:hypothetical protein